jgi:hypothetical protein
MINRSTLATLRHLSAAAALAAMFVGATGPAAAKAAAGAALESSATAAVPAGAAAPRVPSTEVKYCVLDEITGSRLQKKVCKTKKEWKDLGVNIDAK